MNENEESNEKKNLKHIYLLCYMVLITIKNNVYKLKLSIKAIIMFSIE